MDLKSYDGLKCNSIKQAFNLRKQRKNYNIINRSIVCFLLYFLNICLVIKNTPTLFHYILHKLICYHIAYQLIFLLVVTQYHFTLLCKHGSNLNSNYDVSPPLKGIKL